jgi:hypothetical protein
VLILFVWTGGLGISTIRANIFEAFSTERAGNVASVDGSLGAWRVRDAICRIVALILFVMTVRNRLGLGGRNKTVSHFVDDKRKLEAEILHAL